jgi:hypothetical protein
LKTIFVLILNLMVVRTSMKEKYALICFLVLLSSTQSKKESEVVIFFFSHDSRNRSLQVFLIYHFLNIKDFERNQSKASLQQTFNKNLKRKESVCVFYTDLEIRQELTLPCCWSHVNPEMRTVCF